MSGYKAKTIKAIIAGKISKWIDSIDDKTLQQKVRKSVIVTGGAIVSMLLGEEVNDFDVYFKDYETALAVANYYVNKFKTSHPELDFKLYVTTDDEHRVKVKAQSSGIASETTPDGEYKYFESRPEDEATTYIQKVMDNPADVEDTHEDTEISLVHKDESKFRPVYLTSNAITLSDKIQIVLRFYGTPEEIHANYDFVHCTSHWQSWDQTLHLKPEALESILAKELRYVGSRYPICSLVRLRKFIQRGWRINAGQILKMVMQISELDLEDVNVLEDQLTGVDTAYFTQLVSQLKEKDPEKVNSGYLVQILDRMF